MSVQVLSQKPVKQQIIFLLCAALLVCLLCGRWSPRAADPTLTRHTALELVDWNVSNLWLLNVSNVWLRINNFNAQPIKRITIAYEALDATGGLLNRGTFVIDDVVAAGKSKNFVNLPLGLVDARTRKLNVQITSVDSEERAGILSRTVAFSIDEISHLLLYGLIVVSVSALSVIVNDRTKNKNKSNNKSKN